MRNSIKKTAALLVASVMVMGSTISTMAASNATWGINIYEGQSHQDTIRLVSSGTGISCQVSCTNFTNDPQKRPYVVFSGSNLVSQMIIDKVETESSGKRIATTGYQFDVTYKNVGNNRLSASGSIKS